MLGWYTCVCVCLVTHSCLTLCNCMDYSSVHGDSPSKNTGVGCNALLQGIFPTQESNQGPLYCRRILYQLSYEGSPKSDLFLPGRWYACRHHYRRLNISLRKVIQGRDKGWGKPGLLRWWPLETWLATLSLLPTILWPCTSVTIIPSRNRWL